MWVDKRSMPTSLHGECRSTYCDFCSSSFPPPCPIPPALFSSALPIPIWFLLKMVFALMGVQSTYKQHSPADTYPLSSPDSSQIHSAQDFIPRHICKVGYSVLHVLFYAHIPQCSSLASGNRGACVRVLSAVPAHSPP